MIVAFLLVGEEQMPLAERMVASVRRVMRTVPIIQMRDEKTPEVPGIYASKVIPWNGAHLMTYRLQHLAEMRREDMMIVDTDVIVQQDMRRVFGSPFDVALTKREGPILDPQGIDIAKLMPYNTGVMFSKCPAFWRDCYEWCSNAPEPIQKWWGDQLAVKTIAPSYRVRELPCDIYNYSPNHPDEDISGRAVLHYKGNRKDWMLKQWPLPTTPR